MVVGAPQKPEPVGQNLERPFAEHQPVELRPLFQDPEDQVLLFQAGVVHQPLGPGRRQQLLHRHPLQFGDVGLGPSPARRVGQAGREHLFFVFVFIAVSQTASPAARPGAVGRGRPPVAGVVGKHDRVSLAGLRRLGGTRRSPPVGGLGPQTSGTQ